MDRRKFIESAAMTGAAFFVGQDNEVLAGSPEAEKSKVGEEAEPVEKNPELKSTMTQTEGENVLREYSKQNKNYAAAFVQTKEKGYWVVSNHPEDASFTSFTEHIKSTKGYSEGKIQSVVYYGRQSDNKTALMLNPKNTRDDLEKLKYGQKDKKLGVSIEEFPDTRMSSETFESGDVDADLSSGWRREVPNLVFQRASMKPSIQVSGRLVYADKTIHYNPDLNSELWGRLEVLYQRAEDFFMELKASQDELTPSFENLISDLEKFKGTPELLSRMAVYCSNRLAGYLIMKSIRRDGVDLEADKDYLFNPGFKGLLDRIDQFLSKPYYLLKNELFEKVLYKEMNGDLTIRSQGEFNSSQITPAQLLDLYESIGLKIDIIPKYKK